MRFATLALLLVGACARPIAVAERAASDDVQTPLCAFDVEAPEALVGAITHAGTGIDCVPPDGGELFEIGFAHDDWRVVITLPRSTHRIGDTISLDGTQATMLLQTARVACVEWSGAVTWQSDLPSWSASVDATCSDGSARVVGRWCNGSFKTASAFLKQE